MIRTLDRLGAIGSIVGGILTAIFWFLHPRPELLERAGEPVWMISNLLFIVLIVGLQLGVVALMTRAQTRAQLAGWTIAFIADAFFVALGVFDGLVTPVLVAAGQSALLAPNGPFLTGPLGVFFMTTGLLFLVGYIWSGISLARSGERVAGALLVLSAPVLGLSPVMPHPARFVGCAAFGVASVLIGRMLWRER